jgi:hypothetical protein
MVFAKSHNLSSSQTVLCAVAASQMVARLPPPHGRSVIGMRLSALVRLVCRTLAACRIYPKRAIRAEGRRLGRVISGCWKVYNPARHANRAGGCSRAASRRSIADRVYRSNRLRKPSHSDPIPGEAARLEPPWQLTRRHALEISWKWEITRANLLPSARVARSW